MDYHKNAQSIMIRQYLPTEEEKEKASNAYLMPLVAIMVSLPLPIINLIATSFYYIANRKSSYFIRWHITQSLFTQLPLLIPNGYIFWWTVSILWGKADFNVNYIVCATAIIIFNVVELLFIVYTADRVRKGTHIQWILISRLTNLVVRRQSVPK